MSSKTVLPRPSTPSRASVLSAVVPRLRRYQDDMPVHHHKSVLVTLKLSSQSFLDSVIKDDASRNPLYVIRTAGTSTSVLRADPWDGLTKTAEIKWPQRIPTKGKTKETLGVLVQMSDGRWQTGDTILKPGTILSAPSKFSIPNFPHSMKWKRMGNAYWCLTSTVKGPIATFHPAVEGVPPRIKVFETLHDKHDSRSMTVHNGVSILLIDHLIITAMLLVTDVQDWMLVQKYDAGEASDAAPSLPPLSASSSELFDQPQSAPASASQWRKILYGEPLFPKRYPNSRTVSTTDLSAPTPTSMKQMAKIVYGDPIYPSLTSSPVTSLWDSGDEENEGEGDEDEDDDIAAWRAQRGSYSASSLALASPPHSHSPTTRVHSPSSESVFYPNGNGRTGPPSHNYMDPSFYVGKGDPDHGVPPVPQIPTQYALSVSTSSRGTTPPDSASMRGSRTPRELPLPPTPVSATSPVPMPWQTRSQSTPPREAPQSPYGRRPSEPLFLASGTDTNYASSSASASAPSRPPPPAPSSARTLTRSQSMKLRRQLPTPPPLPPPPSEGGLRRSDSRSTRRGSQYSQRSLPVPPGSASAPPPPLPRPPLRKDPSDELWGYSWDAAGPGGHGAGRAFEAPPPYMEAESESPIGMVGHDYVPVPVPVPKRQSTYQP
ncbi:hypothetical protein B0H11DRAFT_2001076 [Mycena galericulata]|nr:hypothetical protein B0H11DRAFT_2001076 [Mycena galericulata]